MANQIQIREQEWQGDDSFASIPGAAWSAEIRDGESVEDAIRRNAQTDCDWSDGRDQPIRLAAFDEDGNELGGVEFGPDELPGNPNAKRSTVTVTVHFARDRAGNIVNHCAEPLPREWLEADPGMGDDLVLSSVLAADYEAACDAHGEDAEAVYAALTARS